jgi:secreted trypsin-like serine protease
LALAGLGCCLLLAGPAAGEPDRSKRIVGGDVADPADWPFIAELITSRDQHYCGAAVVTETAILTAAHCVEGARRRDFRIVTGRFDRNEHPAGQKFRIRDIAIHPDYPRRGRHDIAVLTLGRPTTAPPALLPTEAEDAVELADGAELAVAGWGGTTENGGNSPDVLLDVELFAISDEDCEQYFVFFQAEEEVCAFGEEVGPDRYNDSCYGDSGGPLVAESPRGTLLVGLVSYGGTRCGVKKPGVYQQVAKNLGFIARHAGL